MLPASNSKPINALKNLGRPDVRLSMPNTARTCLGIGKESSSMQLPAMVCRRPHSRRCPSTVKGIRCSGEWKIAHSVIARESSNTLKFQKDMDGIAISFAETRDRKTWIGTRDIGLFRMDQAALDFSCP
jgi:hypothetical protein